VFSPRWRKVLRDLWGNKRRTLLVVLSIAVGVFAVGTVAHMQVLISRDMVNSYNEVNPASAALYTKEPFDDELVEAVLRLPGVAEAEGRRSVVVRFQLEEGGGWHPLLLTAIPDYDDMRINIIRPEIEFGPDPQLWPDPGVFPPPDRELLLERTSLLVAYLGLWPDAGQGDTIRIETPSGKQREVRMAGLVYDFSRMPATFANVAAGYVTLDTLEWLGEPRTFNELHILVAGDRNDKEHIQRVALDVEDRIERNGVTVARTKIPQPGKLPLDSWFQTAVLILGVMGLFSLVLSGSLVINTISALLTQQVRQIGVMKAIGAQAGQITWLYLSMVLIFGLLSLVIAVPLGSLAARNLIDFMSYFINFNLGDFSIPPQVMALEVAMGLLVPLLAALYPVITGARTTVREAISNYGLGKGQFGRGAFDRLIERVRGLPRPLTLSLRNTFRRKGRLALTLITLTLAGTIFISVVSVRASLMFTLEELWPAPFLSASSACGHR
jgi:putative ABC transport system permease protein